MRELLFRAYDKGRKEYLSDENLFIAINKGTQPNKSEIYLDVICNADKYKERFIIEQYTGLTDKSGKKIFEGDIVKNEYRKGQYQSFKIVYNDRLYCWQVENKYGMSGFLCNVIGDIEVIGNIHDNSELLKGGEEWWKSYCANSHIGF